MDPIFFTYLSPKRQNNTMEITEKPCPYIRDISHRTYFRKRQKAIEALSSILRGYTTRDCTIQLSGSQFVEIYFSLIRDKIDDPEACPLNLLAFYLLYT